MSKPTKPMLQGAGKAKAQTSAKLPKPALPPLQPSLVLSLIGHMLNTNLKTQASILAPGLVGVCNDALTSVPTFASIQVSACRWTPKGNLVIFASWTHRETNSPLLPISSPQLLLPRCLMQACASPPTSMSAGVRYSLMECPQASWMTPQLPIPLLFASRTSWRITPLCTPLRSLSCPHGSGPCACSNLVPPLPWSSHLRTQMVPLPLPLLLQSISSVSGPASWSGTGVNPLPPIDLGWPSLQPLCCKVLQLQLLLWPGLP